jgi:hypothetical protein
LLLSSLDSPFLGRSDPHHLLSDSRGESSRYFIENPHRPISKCRN